MFYSPDGNSMKQVQDGDIFWEKYLIQLIFKFRDSVLVVRDLSTHQLIDGTSTWIQCHRHVIGHIIRDTFLFKEFNLEMLLELVVFNVLQILGSFSRLVQHLKSIKQTSRFPTSQIVLYKGLYIKNIQLFWLFLLSINSFSK